MFRNSFMINRMRKVIKSMKYGFPKCRLSCAGCEEKPVFSVVSSFRSRHVGSLLGGNGSGK